MKLSIVIPVFNEEKTIGEILKKVLKVELPAGLEKEIIIIDDGSTDKTLKNLKSQILDLKSDKNVKLIKNKINRGKGAAVRRGIKNASGDILVIQDADLEYNPEDYKKLLRPILENKAKVVYGSRLKELKFKLFGKEKTPLPLHYLTNRFLSFLTNVLYGSSLTDIETGYKMMTKEVYRKLTLESNRFEIEPEITAKILKMGFQIVEVPIITKPRSYKEGKKIKAKDAFLAVLTLLKYRSKSLHFFIFLVGLIICCAFLFQPTFFTSFFQDDFYHLTLAQADSLSSFFHFFLPSSLGQTGLYRPLSVQVYYFLGQKFFGLNSFYYHLFNFGIFSLTILVSFKIFNFLFKDNKRSYFATLIYAISAFHFTTLSFLWGIEELFVCLFYFLAVYHYFCRKFSLSLIFFVLALLCRETAITLPIVLFVWELLNAKQFKRTTPFFIILFLYLSFRLFYHITPDSNIYLLSFSPKVIFNNYFWFFSWGIGAPENLIDFTSAFKISPRFFQIYPPLSELIVIFYLTLVILILIRLVTITFVDKAFLKVKESRNLFLFFSFWFLIGLLPFAILVNHRFAFYLEIPFLGLAGLLMILFFRTKLELFFLFVFFLTSFLTTKFYSKFYWGITRAQEAKIIIAKLKEKYPKLPRGASLYFLNDPDYYSPSKEWGGSSTQASHTLSGCNGPRVIYKDPTLTCYYEDVNPPPDQVKNIFKFVVTVK